MVIPPLGPLLVPLFLWISPTVWCFVYICHLMFLLPSVPLGRVVPAVVSPRVVPAIHTPPQLIHYIPPLCFRSCYSF